MECTRIVYGWTDGQRHAIIRPFFSKRAYKKVCLKKLCYYIPQPVNMASSSILPTQYPSLRRFSLQRDT